MPRVVEKERSKNEVEMVKKNRSIRRRLRKDTYLDLRPYATHIISWARCVGCSKSVMHELVRENFGVSVSGDRLYRFVITELGKWPNSRTLKHGGQDA